MRNATTKRERLDRATKNAKRAWPGVNWKQARALGWRWCEAMWPDDFIERVGGRP